MNDESMRVEWMTSKSDWDQSKLDAIAGTSDLSISQFPPIPADAIDPFYTTQGDIKATKSDSKDEPVNINLIFTPGCMAEGDRSIQQRLAEKDNSDSTKDPVVSDSMKDPVVGDTTKDPATRDSLKDPVVIDLRKEASQHRSKPKIVRKKKKGGWVNNKKVKWTTDTKPPALPTHLLPPPRPPSIEGLPAAAVKAQLRSYFGSTHVDDNDDVQDDVDVGDDYGEPTDDGDHGE